MAQEGHRLIEAATVNDSMAVETQSSETPFWIIQLTEISVSVPTSYSCPLASKADVIFEFPRGRTAVRAQRLRPVTTARGANSSRTFEIDPGLGEFLVPGYLVRAGKLVMKIQQPPSPRSAGRSGRQPAAAVASARNLRWALMRRQKSLSCAASLIRHPHTQAQP